MTTLNKEITFLQLKQMLPLFLTLIAAGLAGNYFNFPIFLNIDFLFGSIFAMLALQFFGLGRGIMAAAIIAGYTYFLWNHPYAIIIMTAEVTGVGWLMRRRKMGLVLADTLYWLIIGMPLVYLFYHVVMETSVSNTMIIMTKQAVNGIANALVARLIFTGYALRSRSSLMSYSEIVYTLLAFFVLCPALIMLAIGSRTDFTETDLRIRSSLTQDSGRVALRLETWLMNRKSAILNLAEMAAYVSPQQLQPYLEQAKKSDLNFLRVGLLNKEATTTAFFPLIDELGQSNIGINFADRPFIPVLKRTLKPMLSEVVMGRIGTPKPVVQIIAPVVMSGEYGGYVTGILNLEQIHKHLDKSSEENTTLYTLLDKNGNVIMTNRTDQTVMTHFVRGPGTLNHLDDKRIRQWVPVAPPNTAIAERWKKSFYVAETAIGDLAEWKLILEQPVAPFQKTLYDNYTGKFSLLFVIFLGALALAELISRKVVVTLEQLFTLTHELPVRLATDGKAIAWPESGIKEANHLINNFREMADSLSEQFIETKRINESLEARVEERTVELLESERLLRLSEERMLMAEQIGNTGSWFYNIETNNIWGSAESLRIFGYPPVAGDWPIDDIENCIPERERVHQALIALISEGREYNLEYAITPADGSPSKVILSIARLEKDAQGNPSKVLGFIQDITERKRAEEEKRSLEERLQRAEKMEAIGTLAGGVAHDLNNLLGALVGYAEMLIMDMGKADPLRELAEEIMSSAERAAAEVQDLLTMARRGVLLREPASLNSIVADLLKTSEIRKMLSSHPHVTIETEYDGDLLDINASTIHIERGLTNLIMNALHAIPEKGKITIRTENRYLDYPSMGHEEVRKGEYAVLSVSDTGSGILPEHMNHLFEPFYLRKVLKQGGTGLGLSVIWGALKDHDGYIDVTSDPGKGTTFTLYFPVSRDGFVRMEEHSFSEYKGNKETILVVDDEENQCRLAARMLTRLDYTVETVGSGEEALEYLANHDADLIVLDMIMEPGMDGYDTYQRILEIKKRQKVIIFSGFSKTERVKMAQELGAGEFIMKPYLLERLGMAVRKELDRK